VDATILFANWRFLTRDCFLYVKRPWTIVLKNYPMEHFAILTRDRQPVKHKNLKMVFHDLLHSKGYTYQERFFKD